MLVTRSRSSGTGIRAGPRSSSATAGPRACSCSPSSARVPARRSAIPSGTRRECQRSRHRDPRLPAGRSSGRSGSGVRTRSHVRYHGALQSAGVPRITVSEANGRASIYLAALSSNLIALAFIGQMSRLGVAFYAFALILLPVLAFVGTVTFLRLVQSSVEDIPSAHGTGLGRSFSRGVGPRREPYLVVLRTTRYGSS